jgi:hypothetical protein
MLLFLARVISFFGHPLLILTYMLLLMLALNPFEFGVREITEQRAMLLLISVFSTTFLIPGAGVALMKPLGLIKSLEMEDKQERIGPYIVTGVFYLWLFKNLHSGIAIPNIYTCFVLGATLGLFFAFFANIFTKISAHATGMGGFVTMILITAFTWPNHTLQVGNLHLSLVAVVGIAVVLAGIVGTARLALNAHTPTDLLRGYGVGVLGVVLAYWLI